MRPGEYTQPLTRTTLVQVPVVSGYVAARLRRADFNPPAISGYDTRMQVVWENVGPTQFAVLLRETDDRSSSGVRYNLMSAVSVVPGGQVTSQLAGGTRPYLEIYCSGTTTGVLRAQISSQDQWAELGFSKTDDTAYYPAVLYQAKTLPTASP